jgi:UDP-N-acetylmuramoyl-L-alanyl-D-glutamate--2,6-diaminopimelate ligase
VGATGARCPGSTRRPPQPVNIRSLLDEVDVLYVSGEQDREVTSVEHDHRRVGPGSLFCCLPGERVDGHDFAAQAAERGAVGVVCERAVDLGSGADVVQIRVPPGRARPSMALLAAAFFGHPSRQLVTAAVTGTNGKTTVSHLLGSVLERAGIPTLVIGTLTGQRTTPEADELQAQLAAERDRGLEDHRTHAVSMEVSSHALAQHRVDGITFDLAMFTNLSHDHLDFHKTMEAYFETKATLFTPEHAAQGIVFADDPAGERLLERARIPLRAVRRKDAVRTELGLGWSRFIWRGRPVEIALTGRFNVDNALVVAEAAVDLGVEPDDVAIGLAEAPPVPGRMELVTAEGSSEGPTVLVDYAHTPAGLEGVLGAIAELKAPGGRVVLVFGCGGNKDRAKRPLMGRLAVALADLVVVTSDNPRDEDPLVIIEQIKTGIDTASRRRAEVVVEPDRRQAIALALARAGPGDVVLIAGRGHETHQERADERVPFDDRAVAREVLACSP